MQTCRSIRKTNFCALKTLKVAISSGGQSIFNANAILMKMQQLQRSDILALELIKTARRRLFVNTMWCQMFGCEPINVFFCMRKAILIFTNKPTHVLYHTEPPYRINTLPWPAMSNKNALLGQKYVTISTRAAHWM